MGSVDVCTILCVAAKRDGVTGKPVAFAERREGGNSEVSQRDSFHR